MDVSQIVEYRSSDDLIGLKGTYSDSETEIFISRMEEIIDVLSFDNYNRKWFNYTIGFAPQVIKYRRYP